MSAHATVFTILIFNFIIDHISNLIEDLSDCTAAANEIWVKLVFIHNECGDITKLLADYAKQNSKRETLTTAVVKMYEAEITKLKGDVCVNQLSVNQKAENSKLR